MCEDMGDEMYWFNFKVTHFSTMHISYNTLSIIASCNNKKTVQYKCEQNMSKDKHHANPIFIFMLSTCWNFIISFYSLSPTMEIYRFFLHSTHIVFSSSSRYIRENERRVWNCSCGWWWREIWKFYVIHNFTLSSRCYLWALTCEG